MDKAKVVLSRCTDYEPAKIADSLQRQFDLLGGIEKFIKPGDRVLLKPNFIAPKRRCCACQSDPAVIIETARLLKDFGARPFVGDSPAWGDVYGSVKALKLAEPLGKLGVPIKQLNRPVKCRLGEGIGTLGISSVALEADVIINLPKFKTHQQLVATFAVKNMFGAVCGKRKALLHFTKGGRSEDFCRMLIGVYRLLNPALTIIDAVTVMDGPGPIRGRARPLGWLISGTDPVALERVCCELVGFDSSKVPVINAAKKLKFGCSDLSDIEISGDDYSNNICTDFEPAQLIPVRFSLLHVCKSICKQIVIRSRRLVIRKKSG